ncbi:hypothetical protein chiPu_0033523, partial [Chiloscyllium punctatum]|nr:hypothetical protein [Chiloscyllium punctatum]
MRRCTWSISNENRIGLVNGSAVSIHHVDNAARFCRVAFILRERRSVMVNRQTDCSEGAGMKIMSVKRKRFRVEQAMGEVVMPEPEVTGGADLGPMHREIMAELRSIRAQMAA